MGIDRGYGFKTLPRLIRVVKKESLRYERSAFSIYLEILRLYLENRIGPNYYLLAGFADPDVSFEVKRNHIGKRKYNDCVAELNPVQYWKITQSKLSEKAILGLLGVSISKFYGVYSEKNGFIDIQKKLKTLDELETLCKGLVDKKICFKILEGDSGKGFLACQVCQNNGNIYLEKLYSNESFRVDEIVSYYRQYSKTGDFIIEDYIEQDQFYSNFNPSSLNTFRIWALEEEDGRVKILGCYLRIGRAGQLTDAGDLRSIKCPVDVNNGISQPGIFIDTPYREELVHHPDNNVQIANVKMKGFDEIIELSKKTLRFLPFTRFAGLDIALSPSGPMIVEVNVKPDADGAAFGKFPSIDLAKSAQGHA